MEHMGAVAACCMEAATESRALPESPKGESESRLRLAVAGRVQDARMARPEGEDIAPKVIQGGRIGSRTQRL